MIGTQILIVFVGGAAFSVVRLTGIQWACSLILGLLSLPVGWIIRLMPDAPIERIMRMKIKLPWRRRQ
jgi:P-type Ca2+ transporter type 2C